MQAGSVRGKSPRILNY